MWIIDKSGAINTDYLKWIGLSHSGNRVVGSYEDDEEISLAMAKDFDKIMQALQNGATAVNVNF